MKSYEFVEKFLAIIKNNKANDALLQELCNHHFLADDYEDRYILNLFDHSFTITDVNSKSKELVTYYLSARDGSPYKLELMFKNRWLVKSLLFQCVSCFGEGGDCLVCGGSGWGVL